MKNISYQNTFTVKNTPQEVYEKISHVNDWWGNVTGNTRLPNDEFRYAVGDTWVDFRVAEMTPGKRIAWNVTDCYLHWLKDKKEWNNTTVTFDIAETADGTRMTMTHEGLTPQVECYEGCKAGWDFYAGKSLLQLITEGVGLPSTPAGERV